MGRARSTTVRFESKEQCDNAPLLAKPNCDPEIQMDSSPEGKLHMEAVSIQGWRKNNEDATFLYAKGGDGATSTNAQMPSSILGALGVFDGHQNDATSKYMAQELVTALGEAVAPLIEAGSTSASLQAVAADCFHTVDLRHRAQEGVVHGGSTAAVVFVTPTELLFFSTGDCRIYLVNKAGEVTAALDQDHRPTMNATEQERLERVGATVTNGRVNGILSVTRALGDYHLKPADIPADQWPIISAPDVLAVKRDAANDYGVIIGCDGVWELQDIKAVASGIQNAVTSPMVLDVAQASVSRNVQMTVAVQTAIPSGCDNVSLASIVFL